MAQENFSNNGGGQQIAASVNSSGGYGKDIMIAGGVAVSLGGLAYIYMQLKEIKESITTLNNRVDKLASRGDYYDNQYNEIRTDITRIKQQIDEIEPVEFSAPKKPIYNNYRPAPPKRTFPTRRSNNFPTRRVFSHEEEKQRVLDSLADILPNGNN